MALTPERIAELERLKAMMREPAAEAQRKAQAIFNAEKGAGQPVKLPTDKSKGGSVLKDLEAYIRQRHGESGAKRVQRAADEVPNLEGLFHEKALREAFDDKKTALMAMNPADFENYATPLSSWHTDPESTRHTRSGDKLNFEEYLQHLARIKGFDSVPYLDLFKSQYLPFPNISGHEGRHRNRSMASKGINKSLVQLRPAYEYRKGLPNETQEEFLAALQDKLGRKPFVLPQNTMDGETRKQIVMPEHFANGGTMSQDAMQYALMNKGGKPPAVTKVTKKSDDRIAELEEAARALLAGEINRTAYDKILKQLKPVRPYTSVPAPATDEEALNALMENKRKSWKANQFEAGDPVGMRLDIPAYQQHGVWVNSLHDESGRKLPTSYAPVSSVRNAVFDAKPSQAQKVAVGETNKSPFAKIKGEWHPIEEQEALAQMQEYLNHPEWHQIGMDPRRRDYFYSRKDSRKPVTHAEHVLQIGPLVLAKNPTFGKRKDFGLANGGSVTHAHHLEIEERPL